MPASLYKLRHRKVLEVLRRWDPIGVLADPACPRDEYDSYAPQLIRLLDSGPSLDDVVNWMTHLAATQMGIESPDRTHTADCAQQLIDYWRETGKR